MNSDRPNGRKKTIDEVTEKLLECIAEASSKFSESAWREYEAEPGEREFESHRALGARESPMVQK